MNDGTQVTATAYVYDGWRCIEEWEATWPVGSTPSSPTYTLAAQYVHGGYIDELLVMRRDVDDNGSLEEYFYHADDQFNIVAVTNASGTVVERYEYGPFGEPTILDPAGTMREGSVIGNTHLWNGREYDEETGLYYYRLRYLDPELGRFTTLDPIGLWGDPNNLGNGYAYVGNRPWTGLDPMGLSIRSLYYGEAYGLDSYPSSNTPMPPRVAGAFRVIGGATEMGGGAAVGAGGTATGVGAIPGVAVATVMIAHGADTVQAGINQMIYGEHWQSYTEQLATAATGSEQAGAYIDLGLGFLDLGAGGVSLLTRTPRFAGAADNVLSCTDNVVSSATRTIDTTAGSEFLDDALRMTDQPLKWVPDISNPYTRAHYEALKGYEDIMNYTGRAQNLRIPGGLAGAIRHERATGQQVGNAWHRLKGLETRKGLQRLKRHIENSHSISAVDRVNLLERINTNIEVLSNALD